MNLTNMDTYLITGKWETETIDGETVEVFTDPAQQDFLLRALDDGNRNLYLRAQDGDISAEGITISNSNGSGEDWTIGNAASKALSVNFLNEPKTIDTGIVNGELLSRVSFDRLAAYHGYKTAETTASFPGGGSWTSYFTAPNGDIYRGTASGAYRNGTKITATGTDRIVGFALVAWGEPPAATRNYPIIYGANQLYLWDTFTSAFVAVYYEDYYDTADYMFMLGKLEANAYSMLIDGASATVWRVNVTGSVAEVTTETWVYNPVGIFDFSNVSIFGTSYAAEVYDIMSCFEIDATDWFAANWASISPKTPTALANAIAAYLATLYPDLGSYASISASAVNITTTITANPFADRRYTFRECLALLAEMMGCNVRISPTGLITFATIGTTPVQAYYNVNGTLTLQNEVISLANIVNNTRFKGRYLVPTVGKVVFIHSDGTVFSAGSGSNIYTMTSNPVMQRALSLSAQVTNLYNLLSAVPAYYASKLTVAHADPRLDPGDIVAVQNREDSTAYNILLTDVTYTWNGMTVSEMSADGKQERTAPDSTEIYADNGESAASIMDKINGDIPAASASTPLMDGTAATGSEDAWARGDHVHPTDTSRVPTSRTINGKPLTADITLSASDVSALPSSTTIPTASTTNPSMDGTASYGSGTSYARSNHVHPTDTTRVAKAGDTMTGQLKTSYRESVAMGSYGTAVTTIPNLVAELRFSSGCAGSVSIGTAYTWNEVTVATGWYNFLYMPHRSGGVNGAASGDNCNYGTILLAGMTVGDVMYRIRINGGTLTEIRRICDSSTTGARVNGHKTVTLASGTSLTAIATFTLSPGTWHISIGVQFASNATGRRQANVSTSSGGAAVIGALACNTNATSGTQALMNFGYDLVVSSTTTYYLNAYQNSGSALSTSGYYSAVRII